MRSCGERGRRGEVIATAILTLLLSAACGSGAAVTTPVPVVADHPVGRFTDDYGNSYDITAERWVQRPHGRFNVIKWEPSARYLIAQNDPTNRYAPGKWSRIDWIRLEGMAPWEWAFCLSAYEAPTADSAEAARVADGAHPRTGCNGYPFSRLKPADETAFAERCHQLYLAAGSDGPKLLAVDAVIVDSTTTPPTRCGQVRSAHPAIKSSE